MSYILHREPTVIPAQPGFFVARYIGGELSLTPIIGWMIQPCCTSDDDAINRHRRDRVNEREPDPVLADSVNVLPVTADTQLNAARDAWWIKHPDGSFIGKRGTRYQDETVLGIAIAEQAKRKAAAAAASA